MYHTRNLVLSGMFAALLTVISQISIPMPSGVPITIQMFGVALAGSVLGWKLGTLSVCTYILLGSVGLPVFSNLRGGLGLLVGFTGGYIWSWPFFSLLCGISPRTKNQTLNQILRLILSFTGLCIVEIVGGLQWSFLSGIPLKTIFWYSITAFLPKDLAFTAAALFLSKRIRRLIGSATTHPGSDMRRT